MAKVTTFRSERGKRLNIAVDGNVAFSMERKAGALSGNESGQLKTDFQRCLKVASRYLIHRPNSEAELKVKLSQRGFDSDTREAVIAKLKQQGLVNDMAFARFWVDNRESFNPRSRWLTKLELKKKGIAGEIVEEAVGLIDDEENAYRIATGKARSLSGLDYESYRRRLGDYLKRRGFSYEVIDRTVERLWQESGR
ncbi:MAG: regulatory protein RecX [Chloroflexota bacterium]